MPVSPAEIGRMTAVEIARKVRTRELSAVEVTAATLARMDACEPHVHAFSTPGHDLARRTASALDAAIARGAEPGPLAGVPVGIRIWSRPGIRHDHGLDTLQGLPARGGRHRRHAVEGGRGHNHRQDQRTGIWLQPGRPQPGLRDDAQSLEARIHGRWLEFRFGRGGGLRRRALRHRQRRWRFDPCPRSALRDLWHQTVDGAGPALSRVPRRALSRSVELGVARTHRADEPQRDRRGPDAECHRRARHARSPQSAAGRVRLASGVGRRPPWTQIAYSEDWGYAAVDPEVRRVVREAVAVFERDLGCTVEAADPAGTIRSPLLGLVALESDLAGMRAWLPEHGHHLSPHLVDFLQRPGRPRT